MKWVSMEDDKVAMSMFKTLSRLGLCQLVIVGRLFRSYGDPSFEVLEV